MAESWLALHKCVSEKMYISEIGQKKPKHRNTSGGKCVKAFVGSHGGQREIMGKFQSPIKYVFSV